MHRDSAGEVAGRLRASMARWWRHGEESEDVVAPPPSRPRATGPRARILLVEDDEPTARLLKRALELDHDVSWAEDGVQGLAMTRDRPAWDVVITDVDMPNMDGITMARQIRRLPGMSHTPIIFLTASDIPGTLLAAIAAGARRYITKPVELAELEAAVRSALRASRAPWMAVAAKSAQKG